LETVFQKNLPPQKVIGEAWEISDRDGDVSVIANGEHAGKDLRWLMENFRAEILGDAHVAGDRFPLLCKILDAQDKLSLQVHPPAQLAAQLGGEPKTEMWYFARTTPTADVYAGLKRGVTRAEFERCLARGEVGQCFHRVNVQPGDALFLPSGRVHAIGAGNLIFEIQQNSDTTYRVFDWNRVGLDGQPRELHIADALAAIDFQDFEPSLCQPTVAGGTNFNPRLLVDDPLFRVTEVVGAHGELVLPELAKPQILAVVSGTLRVESAAAPLELRAGQFCLLPAALRTAKLDFPAPATLLHIVVA
jgi:mannose-6-phosphate isomerase